MTYYSQEGQDRFLDATIFKGHRSGTFVDVGAHDGKTINNTLFFEESCGWSGINIEPIAEVYEKLSAARPACINLNCAVSETDGTADFICNRGYTEMISGLKDHYDPRHTARLDRENSRFGSHTEVINVPTKRLSTIFQENDIPHVHYLSIDVEGAEFSVIKSIDFTKVFIDVIGFENNYKDTSAPIIKYLEEKGYTIIPHRCLDIFMIHTDSPFKPPSALTQTLE
jgi:FkbM family methyltransferase